jgi:hypothetical protein
MLDLARFRLLALLVFAASLAAAAQGVQADPLTDLTARLKSLQGEPAVKGVLDVRSEDLWSEDDAATRKAHSAEITLGIDTQYGLALQLSPEQLQAIGAEEGRHAADPNAPEPATELLRNTDAAAIGNLVSGADTLMRKLDGAVLPAVKPGVLDGAAVTQLSVSRPFRPSKKQRGSVKDYRDDLVISLDAGGMPVAYQETMHGKFCMFLLCVTVDQQESVTLRAAGKGLVAVSKSEEDKQSGLGQGGDTRTVATLQLQ